MTPPEGPPSDRPPLVPPGFPRRALLLLLLLAAVLRVGTSLSRVDEYFPEGLVRGALTQAWISDAPIWPSEAPQLPHIRGSIVMSALAWPAFHVLGPTTFAVRIGGIVFHLAALATLMLLVHRLFGARASVLSGALFVLAPPSLAKIAVLSYGDHIESLPFIFGTAWLALTWCDDRSGRRAGLAFATGVVAGLGCGWHAQARLGVAAVALLCALLAPWKLLRRDFWIGLAPGLLVGLAPLALGDWITARQGLLVQGDSPVQMVIGRHDHPLFLKWIHFWTVDLARSLQIPRISLAFALLLLAVGCAAGLAVAGIRRIRDGRTSLRAALLRGGLLIVYPLIFSVVFAATRYQILPELDNAIPVRYVLPVVPVLLLPIALAGAALLDAGRRGLAVLLVAPPLLLGAWGSLSTWDLDSIGREPARDAVLWETWSEHFAYGSMTDEQRVELRRLELSLYADPSQDLRARKYVAQHSHAARQVALINRFDNDPEWTRPLRFNLPTPLDPVLAASTPQELVARYREVREPRRLFAGAETARQLAMERPMRPDQVAALLTSSSWPFEQRLLLRAFGQGLTAGVPRLFNGTQLMARLAQLPDVGDRREIAFGCGLRIGTLVNAFFEPGDRMLREYLRTVDPALLPPFARGLGAAYRWRFIDPPTADLQSPAVERLIGLLPPGLEADFRAGLGGSDSAY